MMNILNADALNITPSQIAKEQYDIRLQAKSDTNDNIVDIQKQFEYLSAITNKCMNTIAAYYDKQFISDDISTDNLGCDKFGVSYEYKKDGQMYHKSIVNLDKESFFNIYTDMYHIKGHFVGAHYRDRHGDIHSESGIPLGYIRANCFDEWGVMDEDGKRIMNSIQKSKDKIFCDNSISNNSDEYEIL